MKNILLFAILICFKLSAFSQTRSTDTVIVQLANSSKLQLTVGDPEDLSLLKHYDFQALFDDMLDRLEAEAIAKGELNSIAEDENTDVDIEIETDDVHLDENDVVDNPDVFDNEDDIYHGDRDRCRRQNIFGSANLDFGINGYLSNNGFPDNNDEQYAVRPWGSWNIALNSIYHTRVGDNFQFQWGLGLSFSNYKFQDDRTLLTEGPSSVEFSRDERDVDFIKSKLTVSYINVSMVPVVEFGKYRSKPRRWHAHQRDFRAGLGIYGGYRIGSYTRQVYEEDDEREKERARDNFYLTNLRYGLRLQLGLFDTDFFINYDLNHLFADGKGPQLNAYSFGIIF